jgi:hypothetical protein
MRKILLIILVVLLALVSYFFLGWSSPKEDIIWGVNFSQKHARDLGLDWRETYSALIYDLGAKNIKIASYWDLLESQEDQYDFDDLDWQIETAGNNGANVLLVVGMKSPRWPECHVPEWARGMDKEEQQEKIIDFIKTLVKRYKDNEAVTMWQVENEPFFPFGECLWADKEFLKEEVKTVKSLDNRPVMISDSGEGSFWFEAASIGDIVGTTMYRKVWVWQFGKYLTYPFPPVFYGRKANLINLFFDKEVVCVELQAEPWGPELLYTSPLEEQAKTMNLEKFKENIEYAKRTGLKGFYLWGSEWWYWMKEKHGQDAIWQEAKNLFK